jgi:hypothetical protein
MIIVSTLSLIGLKLIYCELRTPYVVVRSDQGAGDPPWIYRSSMLQPELASILVRPQGKLFLRSSFTGGAVQQELRRREPALLQVRETAGILSSSCRDSRHR